MRLIVCEKQVAAKRIAEILSDGKCATDGTKTVPYYVFPGFVVVGLSGHVFRVDFPDAYSSWSKVPLADLVNAQIIYAPDRADIINLVKKLSKKADELVIATDFDTEGESIGLEAKNIVYSVKELPVKRMHFSSITKEEIIDSLANLSSLDVNLANSADARREVDLVWGAVLTRFLSVSTRRLGKSYLSAGRVQSPTLSLIVEKEKERLKFVPEPYWEFILNLADGFNAHYKERVFDVKLRDQLSSLKPVSALISDVSVKENVSSPPIPFNTTDFLRDAAKLGFSGVNAMRLAESLYLKGLISYPRTDNQVYPESIKYKAIIESFRGTSYESLLKFLKSPLSPTRGPKESKDHPPIHPTGMRPEGLDSSELRVYDLVVRRFISTFALDCVEELTKAKFDVSGFTFVSDGYRIINPGWKGVYTFVLKSDNILPSLSVGDSVKVDSIDVLSKETQPPNRYGHGTIIKAMSDLELGTKSTRPSIVQKLIERYYVFYSKSLAPTPVAMAVMGALDSYANIITEPSMTRELELDMESIATGGLTKEFVVNRSRELLLDALKVLTDNKSAIVESIRAGIRNSTIVGSCPKCGSDMKVINARGHFVGCTGYPLCRNSYPLPRTGLLQVTNNVCKDCGLKNILLVRARNRPFSFCPNIDCPSRADEEGAKKLRESRDKYLASLDLKASPKKVVKSKASSKKSKSKDVPKSISNS